MDKSPVAVTVTDPASFELPGSAWLKMPVAKLLPSPSMLMLPALTVKSPACPDEKVSELIRPLLIMDKPPVALTVTDPASFELPDSAWLKMPVMKLLPCPSMLMLPAFTVTAPAWPDDLVEDEILPALTIDKSPVAVTVTAPASFELPELALLKIPVK